MRKANSYAAMTTAAKNEKQLAAEACNCSTSYKEVSSADMAVCGANSSSVKIRITNNNAGNITIPFGTIYSLRGIAAGVEPSKPFLGTVKWYDNLADLVDNYGADLNYVQAINSKLYSKSAVVSSIKVYTNDTALGLTQRQQSLSHLTVPLNIEDAFSKAGSFVDIDLESNVAELLDKAVVLGDSYGILYTVLAGATVDMEFTIASTEVSKFTLR
jgi:hypothetical protein